MLLAVTLFFENVVALSTESLRLNVGNVVEAEIIFRINFCMLKIYPGEQYK